MKIVAYTNANVAPILNGLPVDMTGRIQLMHCRSLEELAAHAADTEVLLTTGKLDKDVLAALPGVRWIQTLSAGIDGLPLELIRERDISLTNAKGIHQIQMSEFAILYMLQWVRRADMHFLNQLDKVWGKRVPAGELYGQTIGVIGTGSIGQSIARKAKAFGMRTLGYNRTGRSLPDFDEVYGGRGGLQQLLAQSDFVILLLPATTETKHFLKMEEFRAMKPSACLINLARGSVVLESDLIEALRNGVIAGAALDVFETEPLPQESPLWELPNVFITPHVAGLSPHYMSRAAEIVYENIRRCENGENLLNLVDLNDGY
jgi:phosphoglycerate dehydrogenase-like enzyme